MSAQTPPSSPSGATQNTSVRWADACGKFCPPIRAVYRCLISAGRREIAAEAGFTDLPPSSSTAEETHSRAPGFDPWVRLPHRLEAFFLKHFSRTTGCPRSWSAPTRTCPFRWTWTSSGRWEVGSPGNRYSRLPRVGSVGISAWGRQRYEQTSWFRAYSSGRSRAVYQSGMEDDLYFSFGKVLYNAMYTQAIASGTFQVRRAELVLLSKTSSQHHRTRICPAAESHSSPSTELACLVALYAGLGMTY